MSVGMNRIGDGWQQSSNSGETKEKTSDALRKQGNQSVTDNQAIANKQGNQLANQSTSHRGTSLANLPQKPSAQPNQSQIDGKPADPSQSQSNAHKNDASQLRNQTTQQHAGNYEHAKSKAGMLQKSVIKQPKSTNDAIRQRLQSNAPAMPNAKSATAQPRGLSQMLPNLSSQAKSSGLLRPGPQAKSEQLHAPARARNNTSTKQPHDMVKQALQLPQNNTLSQMPKENAPLAQLAIAAMPKNMQKTRNNSHVSTDNKGRTKKTRDTLAKRGGRARAGKKSYAGASGASMDLSRLMSGLDSGIDFGFGDSNVLSQGEVPDIDDMAAMSPTAVIVAFNEDSMPTSLKAGYMRFQRNVLKLMGLEAENKVCSAMRIDTQIKGTALSKRVDDPGQVADMTRMLSGSLSNIYGGLHV